MIVSCLLKQLIVLTRAVPPAIMNAFKSKDRPLLSSLAGTFTAYCQALSSATSNCPPSNPPARVCVILDAFDECTSERNREDVISTVRTFTESGVRVYVTTRDYLGSYLAEKLNAPLLEIKADQEDVKKYVKVELEKLAGHVTDNLKAAIVEKVSDGVNGMYSSPLGKTLTLGSS
jgi:hypothetical protein